MYNPQVVFLIKTKLNKVHMQKVRRSYGFLYGIDVPANGSKGGLCLAWKDSVSLSLKFFSGNHIDVVVEGVNNGEQ